MTFNTTSLPLARALRRRTILERQPIKPFPGVIPIRVLLVTPEIDALLDGYVEGGLFPDYSADRLIAAYTAGWLMTVSRKKTNKKPSLEMLEGHDDVWALCARTPRPGWRLLGRFYEKDVFVALRPWGKIRLSRNYPSAAAEVIEDWKELFGAQPPHRSANLGDYLSGVFRDVDEEE